jgi:hypothetical protein
MRYKLLVFLLVFSTQAFSQSQFKHKVVIRGKGCPTKKTLGMQKTKGGYEIHKISKEEKHNTLILPSGFELTEIMEEGYNGKNFELKKESLLKYDSTITYTTIQEKEEKLCLEQGRYKANLSISGTHLFRILLTVALTY